MLNDKVKNRTPPDEFIYTKSNYFLDSEDTTILFLMFDVADNVRFSIEVIIGDSFHYDNYYIRGFKVEQYEVHYRKKYIWFGEQIKQRHYTTIAEFRTTQSTSPLKGLIPVANSLKNQNLDLATVENLEQNKKIINKLNNLKF
jgi:hypothetical protein